MSLKSFAKFAVVGAALSLAGCGGFDGVDLNGKVFDAMGLNTGSVKKADPKLAERQPLVVPPGLDKLPEPGALAADQPNITAEINDHDARKQKDMAALEKQQADYCKVHYEQAQAHGDQNRDLAEGPLGPCKGSVISAIKNLSGGGSGSGE